MIGLYQSTAENYNILIWRKWKLLGVSSVDKSKMNDIDKAEWIGKIVY